MEITNVFTVICYLADINSVALLTKIKSSILSQFITLLINIKAQTTGYRIFHNFNFSSNNFVVAFRDSFYSKYLNCSC